MKQPSLWDNEIDLYNNGLMNRAAGFHTRFGVTKDEALMWDYGSYRAHKKIDEAMDKIIMSAAIEQGVI